MQLNYKEVEVTFFELTKELSKINLAYIHIVDQRVTLEAPDFNINIKKY